jgi:hypothetical protein
MFGAYDLVVKQQVPQLPATLRIISRIVKPELLDQTAYAPSRPVVTCPEERHTRSVTCGCNCGANACNSTAGDKEISVDGDLGHMRLVAGSQVSRLIRRSERVHFASDL